MSRTVKNNQIQNKPASDLMKAVAMHAPVKKKIDKDFSPAEAAEIKRNLAIQHAKKEELAKEETPEALTRREKIINIKKWAREIEKTNQDKLVIFPSYSRNSDKLEWYKMADFSAMYYTYRMANRMGRTARIMKDTDKYAKMKAVVSIKNVELIVKQAMQLGDFSRYEKTLDEAYILYLRKPLTDEEVGVLRRTNETRHEMMHNTLRPKRADAAIYQAILMIDRQVLPRISKMEKGYYVSIGDTMAKQIHQITQTYFKFADGLIDAETARKTLLGLIDGLLAGAALLGELEVWSYDVSTVIGENITNLKRLVSELK